MRGATHTPFSLRGLLALGFSIVVLAFARGAVAEPPAERLQQIERVLKEQQHQIDEQRAVLEEQARTIEAQQRELERLRAELAARSGTQSQPAAAHEHRCARCAGASASKQSEKLAEAGPPCPHHGRSLAEESKEAAGAPCPHHAKPEGTHPCGGKHKCAHRAARAKQQAALLSLPGIWRPRGDTATSLLDRFDVGLGIQYRLMYNASNLPGPAGTTVSDTRSYDFLRQRLRLNLDVSPKGARAGGFLQAEFRGGIGGSSPAVSDPRGRAPSLNPFGRLQARGIRYGFLYFEPAAGHTALAGILPLSDEFGDTLFSADWDLNIGGIALLGTRGRADYRLAYLRLVEGVGSTDTASVGKDGDLLLADLLWRLDRGANGRPLRLGAHLYYLDIGKGLPLGATEELWAGLTGSWQPTEHTALRAFAIVNSGDLGIGVLDGDGQVVSGFDRGDAHTGYALKLEAGQQIDRARLDVQAIYATGDGGDGTVVRNRFVTPEGMLGTEGYWAYTHVLTANGPSDVGDLGLEIGGGGAGMLTVQGRLHVPLHERVDGELFAGHFRADRARSGSRTIGTEVGGMTTARLAEGLSLDVGVAGAFLGDFFGAGADDLWEAFSRLQFQY